MKILVPRIAEATTRKDLRAFVNRVLESWFRLPFSAQPRIVSCRVLTVSDIMGVTRRHGIIDITPDDAARKIIRKLDGAYLGDKKVGVKEYEGAASRALGLA